MKERDHMEYYPDKKKTNRSGTPHEHAALVGGAELGEGHRGARLRDARLRYLARPI